MMNESQRMRAKRYHVCVRTCRELEKELQNYVPVYADPARNAEVIASTKRTLAIFRKEVAFIECEIDFEAEFEIL